MSAGLSIDLRPLRQSPDLRRLLGGRAVAQLGSTITAVAAALEVYRLSHSSLAVGAVAITAAGPMVLGMQVGGSLADSMDRRLLIIWTQVGSGIVVTGLALNALLPAPRLWLIFLLVAVAGASLGVGSPARAAAVPTLVKPELMPSAAALNSIVNQGAVLVGPAVAGLLVAHLGFALAYGVNAMTFLIYTGLVIGMSPLPRSRVGGAGLSAFVEGLRFVRGHRLLLSLLVVDLNAMVFGMPTALFPALGTGRFHGGATAVGLLYSAPAAGALLGAATSGWLTRVYRAGPVILGAVLLWGAALVGFGLCPLFPLALLLLALAGAADLASEVLRGTLLQLAVPDELRGRVNALSLAEVTGAPALGNFEAGVVGTIFTPVISVVSGGIACMVGVGLIARLSPTLRGARLRAGTVTVTPVEASSFSPEPRE
ncbi:MAG TPA: MFS transporter [Candidatus Dormibacteraeota bacterium]